MTDSRKQAEAVVKAAEKAYTAAAKKADDALAKYRPLRAAANRAARELAYAKSHPDLFDDDDLAVIDVTLGGVELAAAATVVSTYLPTPAAAFNEPEAPPVADPTFDSPITVAGVPAEERTTFTPVAEAIAQHAEQSEMEHQANLDETAAAVAADTSPADPWDAPPPAAEPEKKARKPRATKAEMEARRAAEAAAKAGVSQPTLEASDDDSALDGDADAALLERLENLDPATTVMQVADPFASVTPQQPFQAPVAQAPEGYIQVGVDQAGQPQYAKLQQPTATPTVATPVIKPPF